MAGDDTNDSVKIDRRPDQHRREWELFQLLEQVPVGVFVVNSAGKPYYANEQARALLGMRTVPDHVDRFSEVYQAFEIGTDRPYPVERLPLTRALAGERWPRRASDCAVGKIWHLRAGRRLHRTQQRRKNGDTFATSDVHMRNSLLVFALTLAGCMADISASSRTYLGPEQSGAVTTRSVDDTAREVTRLFEARGFAMADQHVDGPDRERMLKFAKGNRAFAAEKDDSQPVGPSDVGSVFYAWVTPAAGGSTVSILGKPTLAGAEPCTNDGVWLPCTQLRAEQEFAARYLTGHAEADIAHGILSQLELEGYAIGPLPPNAPVPDARAQAAYEKTCKARRHELLLQAAAEQDPATKQRLVQDLPTC
jgi:hypothetical protein